MEQGQSGEAQWISLVQKIGGREAVASHQKEGMGGGLWAGRVGFVGIDSDRQLMWDGPDEDCMPTSDVCLIELHRLVIS